MNKLLSAILFVLVTMTYACMCMAHGSSHPRHCVSERIFVNDLMETCTKDGVTTVQQYYNYYSAENIEKRKQEEIANKIRSEKFTTFILWIIGMIVVGFIGSIIYDSKRNSDRVDHDRF
jgi:hypothetical protein